MSTTAINNYIDYKKATVNTSKSENSIIEKYEITENTALNTIYILLAIAIISGIFLTLNTSIVVLLIGAASFMVGIFYTYGPIPISRMPLGEAFSGFFMGFLILFLAMYIHIYDNGIVFIAYTSNFLSLNINILEIFKILLLSIPTIAGIANIMLANNICDLEEDILNNRFTLPYYIGKKKALKLFSLLYYISYISLVILIFLKIVPVVVLLVLATIIPVYRNIKIFTLNPNKDKTFALSVKNFALINICHILIIGSVLLKIH
jgi:1,4-dihydroxy-2-naphthoate octaprenyltransferase